MLTVLFPRMRSLLRWRTLGQCLLVVASTISVYHFVRLGILYAQAGITSDAELYFAMGRGWLNGLTFYRDLFETKPPLAFLLPALSLKVSADATFYFGVQLVLLFLLAPLLAYRHGLVGFLFGITMAVEALHRSLGYQMEGFALLFATLPALIPPRPLLSAGAMGMATMFKEPFLASAVLALALTNRKKILATVIRALVFCLVVLSLTGCLKEYFSIYLPEIVGGRSADSLVIPNYASGDRYYIPAPLWVRSLNILRLFTELPPLLATFLFICLVSWCALQANRTTWTSITLSGATLAASIVTMHLWFLILSIEAGLQAQGQSMIWNDPLVVSLLVPAVALPLVGVIAIAGILLWQPSRWAVVSTIVVALVGLLVASSLVAVGGNFESRHLIFAFPCLIAIGSYALGRLRLHPAFVMLSALLLVNSFLLLSYDYPSASADLARQKAHEDNLAREAKQLDQVMDSCRIGRYLLADVALQGLAAYTVHSPFQISYGEVRSFSRTLGTDGPAESPNSYFQQKMTADLAKAQLIVAPAAAQNPLEAPIEQAIRQRFTDKLPTCGRVIGGLRLYFASAK
jgi:hypothetical protein